MKTFFFCTFALAQSTTDSLALVGYEVSIINSAPHWFLLTHIPRALVKWLIIIIIIIFLFIIMVTTQFCFNKRIGFKAGCYLCAKQYY